MTHFQKEANRMIQDLTRGNPASLIVKFALPLLIGNLFQQLYQVSDIIIVGRLISVDALAALGASGTDIFRYSAGNARFYRRPDRYYRAAIRCPRRKRRAPFRYPFAESLHYPQFHFYLAAACFPAPDSPLDERPRKHYGRRL